MIGRLSESNNRHYLCLMKMHQCVKQGERDEKVLHGHQRWVIEDSVTGWLKFQNYRWLVHLTMDSGLYRNRPLMNTESQLFHLAVGTEHYQCHLLGDKGHWLLRFVDTELLLLHWLVGMERLPHHQKRVHYCQLQAFQNCLLTDKEHQQRDRVQNQVVADKVHQQDKVLVQGRACHRHQGTGLLVDTLHFVMDRVVQHTAAQQVLEPAEAFPQEREDSLDCQSTLLDSLGNSFCTLCNHITVKIGIKLCVL